MRHVTISLAVGLLLTALAVAITLTGEPMRSVSTGQVPETQVFARIKGGTTICQGNELLPVGAEAISPSIFAAYGPTVTMTAYSHGRLVTSGTRGSGWIGVAPTIPVTTVRHSIPRVTICMRLGRTSEENVELLGSRSYIPHATSSVSPHSLPGRMTIFYKKRTGGSWWSNIGETAQNIGFGHTPTGSTLALLLLALMTACVIGGCWLAIAELGAGPSKRGRSEAADRVSANIETPKKRKRMLLRRARDAIAAVPRAALICATLAIVNAICWSLIIPPLQVPDEQSHFAYVQQLAEAQSLPTSYNGNVSQQEISAVNDLRQAQTLLRPATRFVFAAAERRAIEADLSLPYSRRGSGAAVGATSEPPLYYALETVPYMLASKGTILDQIELMRFLSALMAGVTALFSYLFLRETLPRTQWAWAVGGFGVAIFPTLGFASGGVNPDAMLFAVCAALFYCFARGFRRGLDTRLAIAIGSLIAIGLLTKLNFLGFVPGALLGLIWLAWRQSRACNRAVYLRTLVPALAIVVTALISYAIVNTVSGRPLLGIGHSTTNSSYAGLPSPTGMISFIWQLYLPRLPWMHDYFGQLFTARQLWFNGLVGLYGWLDTQFPGWVYDVALIPAAAIAALALVELVKRRASLARRAPELALYATMACGLLLLIGLGGASDPNSPGQYAEPRYLLPMLPLWGAVLALAARAAGRRWAPVIAALLIVLLLSHDIFSQLQVIARYYG